MNWMLRLFAVLAFATPLVADSSIVEWTWIHGTLDGKAEQGKYLKQATETFQYYQDRGMLKGRLVSEAELDAWPASHVVAFGPLEAFEDPARFGLPIEVADDGTVTVAGHELRAKRTGIFLRDAGQTRFAYTGLSFEGFQDVFTVPTGNYACTITTGRGRIGIQGNWSPGGLVLEVLPFLEPYPDAAAVRALQVPSGAITIAPVLSGPEPAGLDPKFKAWLDGFVAQQRVLYFGESHWNTGVNHVFLRSVEHLLRSGRLRTVLLELNYSFSGFYDYYVTEPDAARAKEFLEERLHPLMSSASTLELLEILRAWNLAHPEQRVRVGCVDMEWSGGLVVQRILQPYFRGLDGDTTLRMMSKGFAKRLQELLDRAREEKLVGDYPFLTADYIGSVVTNLQDTLALEDFDVDRQRAIIRNLTEFHGPLLEEGLVVAKCGAWHAMKRKVPQEKFRRDAAHLYEVHPTTKGKVVTLFVQGLGYSFLDFVGLNLRKHMASATNYNNFVSDFQKALGNGSAEADRHYLLDRRSLTLFDQLVIGQGYALGHDILRIDAVDWAALQGVHGAGVRQGRIHDYDAMVYVLRSGMEVMRPLKFEER